MEGTRALSDVPRRKEMILRPYTQVRLKRTLWDTKHKTQALYGAMLEVESFSRGVYGLFALTVGGRYGLAKMRFRCRRSGFSVLRQQVYGGFIELEIPDKEDGKA